MLLLDVKHAIQLVRRSVEQFEPRFLSRALKMTPSLLRRLDQCSLHRAIKAHAPDQGKNSFTCFAHKNGLAIGRFR